MQGFQNGAAGLAHMGAVLEPAGVGHPGNVGKHPLMASSAATFPSSLMPGVSMMSALIPI